MSYSFGRLLRAGTADHAAVVRFCAGLGAQGVELMEGLLPEAELPAVRQALRETGTGVPCYDFSARFTAPSAAEREAAVSGARAALERAASVGAPCVLVVPGEPPEGVEAEVARGWIVECLQACAADAARLGLKLTLEHRGLLAPVYGSSANLLSISEAVGPQAGVTCDVGNAMLAGERGEEAVRRLAGRIEHVHLKDWRPATDGGGAAALDGRRYVGVALGEGVVDLPAALSALREVSYTGAVSVEYEGEGDPREAVRRGVTYLQRLLAAD